jgi:signal transduction histidine kinase
LVEQIVANLNYQLELKQGAVYAQNLPKVMADQTSLEQIFANLLDNATKYWYQGRPLEIHITAKQKNDEIIFAIKDNGRGIAREDMDKVFAPFRRIGASQELGEGMGMAYVQAIVRNMGGRIWIESEISIGTTVFFTIPRKSEEKNKNE